MKVVSQIVEALQAESAPYLFCYPSTPLIDAAARKGLRPIISRQERVGLGIADGYSRTSNARHVVPFAMQFGPGAENAVAALASAHSDNVPLLILPMGYEARRRSLAPFSTMSGIYPAVSRYHETLDSADEVLHGMRRAVSRYLNGPPGPIVLEIAQDIGLAEAVAPEQPYLPVVRARTTADDTSVTKAAEAIVEAARPLVVVGQGVLYAEATAELIELAELLNAPVMTTLAGKSAFPDDHPLSIGTGALTSPATVPHFIEWCDLVIGVGSSLKKHFMTVDLPDTVPMVQITRDADDLNAHYRVEHPLVGDARLVLQQLLSELRERRFSHEARHPERVEIRREIARVRETWLAEWQAELTSSETPINPYRFVHEFIKAVDPAKSIVTHDSGSPRDQLLPFYRATTPRSYIGWGKSHALGSGLGLIMGAKLARPDLHCLNVMGDAAFGMVGLDLETAVRERIPIVTVVLNNNIMAIETDTMRVAHSKYGSRKLGGEYVGIARSLGALAARVHEPAEIGPTLQLAMRQSQEQGLPFLVEVITRAEMTAYSHRKF